MSDLLLILNFTAALCLSCLAGHSIKQRRYATAGGQLYLVVFLTLGIALGRTGVLQ